MRIEEACQKVKVAPTKKYRQEYTDTNKNFLENMTEDVTEWLNYDLGQAVQGSLNTITSGMIQTHDLQNFFFPDFRYKILFRWRKNVIPVKEKCDSSEGKM